MSSLVILNNTKMNTWYLFDITVLFSFGMFPGEIKDA